MCYGNVFKQEFYTVIHNWVQAITDQESPYCQRLFILGKPFTEKVSFSLMGRFGKYHMKRGTFLNSVK